MSIFEKVIEEIETTKQNLLACNASWLELYKNFFAEPGKGFDVDIWGYKSAKTTVLGEIKINNSTRKIEFNSDGNINLIRYKDKSMNKSINYKASYNIEFPYFEFNIDNSSVEKVDVSLFGNLLKIKHENMEFVDMLDKSKQTIFFKQIDNLDKTTRTYVINIDEMKNVIVDIYSKDGSHIMSDTFENVLVNTKNSLDELEIPNIIRKIIDADLLKDTTNINLVSIANDFEKYVVNMLNELKNEIPLNGLVDRIDNLNELMVKIGKLDDKGFQKINKKQNI